MANEKKRSNDLLEQHNSLQAKKFKYENEGKLALYAQLKDAYEMITSFKKQLSDSVDNNNMENNDNYIQNELEFWVTQLETIKRKLSE